MNIAIVGYGIEGQATYNYFEGKGHTLTICDQNSDLVVPEGANTALGKDYLDGLDKFDLIVRSAGLRPETILDKNPGTENKITSHINEFMAASPTTNIVGVTGTKGKGTTSSLIKEMLIASGQDAYLGGNIGVPPLEFIDKLTPNSWVVLELSSFQLVDLKKSPHIAVCLMLTPEHLNWHKDMNSYLDAKANLFKYQSSEDIAIYLDGNDLSKNVASSGHGRLIPYFAKPGAVVSNNNVTIADQLICKTSELKLLGEHNWENVCAALTAVWQIDQDTEAIKSVLTSFKGLEHRIELVKRVKGVRYYDDSFGTTPETAIVAIKAFNEPKLLIVGGSDKGASYTSLVETIVNENVKFVICIGHTGEKIATELGEKGLGTDKYTYLGSKVSMSEIVRLAATHAVSGDVVLLSSASASFDMFRDYKDRGNQFKAAVQALPEGD